MLSKSILMAAISAGVTVSFCAPPQAQAAILTDGGNFPYGAEICAEAEGLTFAPGTPVDLHGCHAYTNQQWNIELGRIFSYGLSDKKTVCLDVAGGAIAPGSAVVINLCSSASSQLWTIGGGPARGQIINTNSALCLDGTTMKIGAPLVINTCESSGLSQQWEVK